MVDVPEWFNDSELEAEPVIIFKTELVHYLRFLNEGVKGTSQIKDNDGETKDVPCVNFLVSENGKEMKFNPISKQLIKELKESFPLTNKELRIELIKGRTNFENIYKITEME